MPRPSGPVATPWIFAGRRCRFWNSWGLVDAVKQHETRTGSITMVDANNHVVARLPDGFSSGDLEIQRGDLSRVLYEATSQETNYIFNDSIQEMQQTAECVSVTFVSGKTETFDFVVGADGLHSNVRSIAFGKESEFTYPMGYYIAVFTVPDFMGLGDAGRYYAELGKRVGCFGTPNDGTGEGNLSIWPQRSSTTIGATYQRKNSYCARRLLESDGKRSGYWNS